MNKSSQSPKSPADSLLVSPGKSTRLQAMRERAAANRPEPAPPPISQALVKDENFCPELTLARQLIDQRLTGLLASLPTGKQRSLFKIRFGMEPDQIKALPIQQIFALLEIQHPSFNNLSANMKRIGDLNYNGQQPN